MFSMPSILDFCFKNGHVGPVVVKMVYYIDRPKVENYTKNYKPKPAALGQNEKKIQFALICVVLKILLEMAVSTNDPLE